MLWYQCRIASLAPRGCCMARSLSVRCSTRDEDAFIAKEDRVTSDGVSRSPVHKKKRRRLDEVCAELYPEYSRNVIQSFIAQGKVLVDDRPVTKSGTQIDPNRCGAIRLTAQVPQYVCRAGLKMQGALEAFFGTKEMSESDRQSMFKGRMGLDAGLSTGGFTDCLLQHGMDHVVGVDVGYGQVAEKIRVDPRVTIMERTNLRHLRRNDIGAVNQGRIDFVSLDVSFISTLKMRDAVCDIMEAKGDLILLIKPQFEAGKENIGAGGVVRDAQVREEVVSRVVQGWEDVGFRCRAIRQSAKSAASRKTKGAGGKVIPCKALLLLSTTGIVIGLWLVTRQVREKDFFAVSKPSSGYCTQLLERNQPILVCAHGGEKLFGDLPNSLQALERAIERGVGCIEVDLSISKDDVLVAVHDRDLPGFMNKPISQPAHSLSSSDLLEAGVSKFEEIFDLASEYGTRFIVDVKLTSLEEKDTVLLDQLVNLLETRGDMISNEIIVWCKDDNVMKRLHDIIHISYPHIKIGITVMDMPGKTDPFRIDSDVAYPRMTVVGQHWEFGSRDQVEALSRKGRRVFLWTSDAPYMMKKSLEQFPEAIVTSYPSTLMDMMDAWHTHCITKRDEI